MHECTERRHEDVQNVTEEKDEHEWKPSYDAVSANHLSKVVECLAEHTAGKSEGEETDVTEHVTEDTGCHVIGVPKSCSDVDERVLTWSVEDVDSKCREGTDNDNCIFDSLWRDERADAKDREDDASDDQENPAPGAYIGSETESLCISDRLHNHSEADVEYSDSECEKHLDVEHSHSRYFNLTHDHAALEPLRHPCCLCHAHSEECSEHCADNHGSCTED